MNKEYTYVEGKIIVRSEEGNHTITDYYDNIESALIYENVIEVIQNRINYLENISFNNRKFFPTVLCGVTITSLLGSPLIIKFTNPNMFYETINTIFGNINNALLSTISTCTLVIPIGGLYSFKDYYFYNEERKNSNGRKCELEYLKEELEKSIIHLAKLKKDKSREKEDNKFRQIKVNDVNELHKIKYYCDLYFDFGYNEDKYYKYYKKFKLNKKLKNRYDSIDIEFIEKKFMENIRGSKKILKK